LGRRIIGGRDISLILWNKQTVKEWIMEDTESIEECRHGGCDDCDEEVLSHATFRLNSNAGNINVVIDDGAAYDNAIQMLKGIKPILRLKGRTLWSLNDTAQFALVVTNLLLAVMILILFFRLGTFGL
jgi:hypothetical protein